MNDLYTCKAWAYNELGQYDQAIEWGRRSIASNPSSGGYVNLGWAYVTILLGPHDPVLHDLYEGKAKAYLGLKQYDQANEWLRRAAAQTVGDYCALHLDAPSCRQEPIK